MFRDMTSPSPVPCLNVCKHGFSREKCNPTVLILFLSFPGIFRVWFRTASPIMSFKRHNIRHGVTDCALFDCLTTIYPVTDTRGRYRERQFIRHVPPHDTTRRTGCALTGFHVPCRFKFGDCPWQPMETGSFSR